MLVLSNCVLVNISNGEKAIPTKSYSLYNLIDAWKRYKEYGVANDLADLEVIKNASSAHKMVMNIEVGGWWDSSGCVGVNCKGCFRKYYYIFFL